MKDHSRSVFVVVCCLVFLVTGCTPYLKYIRFDALPGKNLNARAGAFLEEFERIFELESRYELEGILYERFGGHRWGSNRIGDRMNTVFNQYEGIDLRVGSVNTRTSSRRLIVTFDWTLTWTCSDINPSQGCGDTDEDGDPDQHFREGRTIFSLVYVDEEWLIENEEGDLLLGSFEPGYKLPS